MKISQAREIAEFIFQEIPHEFSGETELLAKAIQKYFRQKYGKKLRKVESDLDRYTLLARAGDDEAARKVLELLASRKDIFGD